MNLVQYTATLVKLIKLLSWPVGSIYTSAKPIDPHELLGGAWEPIQDTFLWCAGPKHAAGEMGGEETHTLTIEEMPKHTHQQYVTANPGKGSYDTRLDWNLDAQDLDIYPQVQTGSTGGGSRSVSCRRIRPSMLGSARLNVCVGGAC